MRAARFVVGGDATVMQPTHAARVPRQLVDRTGAARVRLLEAEELKRLDDGALEFALPVDVADALVSQPLLALRMGDGARADVTCETASGRMLNAFADSP